MFLRRAKFIQTKERGGKKRGNGIVPSLEIRKKNNSDDKVIMMNNDQKRLYRGGDWSAQEDSTCAYSGEFDALCLTKYMLTLPVNPT